jgi:hypothetical protein
MSGESHIANLEHCPAATNAPALPAKDKSRQSRGVLYKTNQTSDGENVLTPLLTQAATDALTNVSQK